jgi:hypothetical protein
MYLNMNVCLVMSYYKYSNTVLYKFLSLTLVHASPNDMVLGAIVDCTVHGMSTRWILCFKVLYFCDHNILLNET